MKKYVEKINRWKTAKVLEFLGHFFKNHQGSIKNSDVFKPITDLMEEFDWESKIRSIFPEKTIEMMKNDFIRRNRLDFSEDPQEIFRSIWNFSYARKRFSKMIVSVVKSLQKKYPAERYSDEVFPRKLAELQATFGLSDFETNIMLVFAFISNDMLSYADTHGRMADENDKATFTAKCINCDVSDVMAALEIKSKLRRYNCLDEDFDFNRCLFEFLNGIAEQPLRNNFFKLSKAETLPWDFYGNLAEKHGTMIKNIFQCHGNEGSNILLYGAPGTGKTSFAKSIAEQLGRKCYIIAQDTKTGARSTCSPEFRFAALQICDSQIDTSNSLIIVDEADDMLSSGSGVGGLPFVIRSTENHGDKGLLNDVLDNIKTPTIWITNTPADALDESSRRRFDYSVCFEPLNVVQRKNIWQNNIKKMQMESLIDDRMTELFASRYDVNAGIITKVLSNVKKLTSSSAEVNALVENLMTQHCELLNIQVTDDKLLPAKDYSLDGLNIKGDIELQKIVAAVRKFQREPASDSPDRPRMNILLSGSPGTGKSEFVKYLGSVLGTKVSIKMGSDLLSMYVGGTEQNIKAVFSQAEAEHAILFLDEIDGLVQNRERANRSWEVTQVNELLYQMENFNGIMIGATNFVQNLDPAIMRRFTFKLGFDYLNNDGKAIFFERMFNTKLSAEERSRLDHIENLAPGDFRTVRQSLYYLDEVSNNARLSALEQESSVKKTNSPNLNSGRIGF